VKPDRRQATTRSPRHATIRRVNEPVHSGKVLGGRYSLGAKLGAGGWGSVYAAVQTDLGRPAAIKVLHTSVALESDGLVRFERVHIDNGGWRDAAPRWRVMARDGGVLPLVEPVHIDRCRGAGRRGLRFDGARSGLQTRRATEPAQRAEASPSR
jgi:serine/threonine protein kinase